jgi:predicted Zn-dependent protease
MKRLFFKFHSILFALLLATFPLFAQTDSATQIQQALQLLQTQNFPAAVVLFDKILRAEPNNDKARIGFAIALIGIEKYAEASREIAKLLARSPNDKNLLEMAAKTFWQQKRFVEAEKVLKRRLDLGDASDEIWALYGDALDAQKKTGEAITAYEKAVILNSDSITLRYALGALYWKAIRYDEAEKVFLDILRRQPDEPRASFNLGDIYLTNGDAAKAIPYLEKAVKSFPDEFDTHFALGRAYLGVNQFEKAIVELERAIKINDRIAEGFYHLGRALQRAGRADEAKKAMAKAQELKRLKLASESLDLRKQN